MLVKILAIETSDYYYPVTYIEESTNKYLMCYIKPYIGRLSEVEYSVDTRLYIPCWSLAALLKCLSEIKSQVYTPVLFPSEGKWILRFVEYGHGNVCEVCDSSPVDACIKVIEYLHELNLL